MNLAQILIDSWRRDPEHVAIKLDDAELNYAQLNGATAHFVGLLREHGFQHGDRVGIMLPNVPYFPVCYYGVLRAGGVVVPMNVLLKKREISFYLEDSGARLLFAWDGFAEDAQAGADAAGAECILVKAGEFEHQVGAARPLASRRGGAGRRHGGDPVHVRDDRHPEGGRALARKSGCATRTQRSTCSAPTPTRSRSARCRCFTHSGRPAG